MGTSGNSPLAHEVKNKKFSPANELEVLLEQKKLIELIDVNTKYMGIHGLNTVAFDAVFPLQQKDAIERIDNAIESLNAEYLNNIPERYSV